jgi:hypothetical protein
VADKQSKKVQKLCDLKLLFFSFFDSQKPFILLPKQINIATDLFF